MSDTPRRAAAAFIDRDGVINVERNYVHRPDQFELLPGAIDGMLRLRQAGYKLIVITNQAGIARGYYTEKDLQQLNAYMRHLLSSAGVILDGIYYCPHHPEGIGIYRRHCNCRKPAPGMLLQAALDLNLDLPASVLIGDTVSDIAAGRAANVKSCVLVKSGHEQADTDALKADYCAKDLDEAARWITGREASK
jgi:D-glycero-D-manno-heptose 1,7-bisphosphate phosphatase